MNYKFIRVLSKNRQPRKLCCKLVRLLFLKEILTYSPERKKVLSKTRRRTDEGCHVFPSTFHARALLGIEVEEVLLVLESYGQLLE